MTNATTNELQDFLRKKIYHWVGRNFGSQEADEPSWNIDDLSKYLAKELGKRDRAIANTKPYELTILFRTELDAEKELYRVREMIEREGGKVVSMEVEGKKRLAYSINNEEYATYTYMNLELPEGKPASISSKLNITDEVLRYLLVQEDTRRR